MQEREYLSHSIDIWLCKSNGTEPNTNCLYAAYQYAMRMRGTHIDWTAEPQDLEGYGFGK